MARETHSAKALATLGLMGTAPEGWALTEIKWVEEERLVPTMVKCPTCRGHKFICRDEERKPIPVPKVPESVGYDHPEYEARRIACEAREEYLRKAHTESYKDGRRYGNCPTCARRKGSWGMLPTGEVKELRMRPVMVGYPQWPEGTRFDSRFHGGLHCHLCNKLIMKSNRVPVNTAGATPHGMWVGEDCAKKFLSVKLKKVEDAVMDGEDK